jgi:hypothetical protein
VVPTAAETLRIKAWLALVRNQTRDYLDIAALADHIGFDEAAAVLTSRLRPTAGLLAGRGDRDADRSRGAVGLAAPRAGDPPKVAPTADVLGRLGLLAATHRSEGRRRGGP